VLDYWWQFSWIGIKSKCQSPIALCELTNAAVIYTVIYNCCINDPAVNQLRISSDDFDSKPYRIDESNSRGQRSVNRDNNRQKTD